MSSVRSDTAVAAGRSQPDRGALRTTAGWVVNDKRVERIWWREGLKVPAKQPQRSRFWLADGSCLQLRAERPNHVWSYDFVEDRTHEGSKYRMLNIIDEFTHECLAIRIDRKLKSVDVIDVLSDLFILRGVPERLRSDNGPEFVAKAVQDWIAAVGAKAAYIAPGSPWENGFIEIRFIPASAARPFPQERAATVTARGFPACRLPVLLACERGRRHRAARKRPARPSLSPKDAFRVD